MTKVVSLLSFLALAACGDPDHFADAGAQDDAGEDPDSSGQPGTVTVHVAELTATGEPDTDATVYFNAADGDLLESKAPGADGVATGMMEPGGSVTVAFGTFGSPTLRTVVGVAADDELWFGPYRTVTAAGTMTVTLPAATGAIRYGVVGPCATSIQGASTTVSVTLSTGCSATRPLLAIADRGLTPAQYISIPNATPTDGATLDVTGPWVDPIAGPSISVTGIPGDVATRAANAVYFADDEQVAGVSAPLTAGDPATATFGRLPGLDQAMTAVISMSSATFGYQIQAHVTPIPSTTLAIDATPTLPMIDVQQQQDHVTWTTTTAGVADAIFVSTELRGSKRETLAEWDFVVAGDADGFDYPSFPERPETSVADVQLLDVDVIDGFDDLRAHAGEDAWRFGPPPPAPAAFVTHTAYVY